MSTVAKPPAQGRAAFVSTAEETTRQRTIAAAAADSLKGRRAEAWLGQWDKGNRRARQCILEAFLALHGESTSETVAADLGDAMPLFFTRVTSWLRLGYCTLAPAGGAAGPSGKQQQAGAAAVESSPSPPPGRPRSALLLMVQSLAVMLRGGTYITQFIESGLSAALTDCLERGATAAGRQAYAPLSREEKAATVLLLLYVASAGRVYREMICDEDGLASLLRVMQAERDEGLAALLTDLFVLLGQGNPRLAPLVQCGLLRFLVSHCECGTRAEAAAQRAGARRAAAALGLPVSGAGVPKQGEGEDDEKEGEEEEENAVVVLEAARALRALQLHKESHHYSVCQQRGAHAHTQQQQQQQYQEGSVNGAGVPELDQVPVVGYSDAGSASAPGRRYAGYAESELFRRVTGTEFLDALFYLALDDGTRFRVEGGELLAMAAKNAELLPRILNRALDVLDDDVLVIADDDDTAVVSRRHRRQLSCGRVAVQVMLTAPTTEYRRRTIVDLFALRGAHLSLLKYLRLTGLGDTATVVDCCHALQFIARASEEAQRASLSQQQQCGGGGGAGASSASPAPMATSAVMRMGHAIRDALGSSPYEVLLHDAPTPDVSLAMMRAARASATSAMAW